MSLLPDWMFSDRMTLIASPIKTWLKTHLRCLQTKYEESENKMKKQKLKIDILEAEKSNLQSEKNILEAEKKTFEVRLEAGIHIFENQYWYCLGKSLGNIILPIYYLDEFQFRWFEISTIQIGKTALFPLIFNHLNWNPSESVFCHILPFVSVAALSKDAINFISLSVFVYGSDWPKEFWFLIGWT